MNSNQLNTTGRQLALISFLLGTIIFITYFLTSGFAIIMLGYAFMAIAGLLNLFILIYILKKLTKEKDNKKTLLTTTGIMLLNIPISLIYCWITMVLINTMRITFTNATQTTISDIKITGCETEHINNLGIGQSKTVWVGITGDCAITIDYLNNGHRVEEIVAGYVTSGMGQKIKHNIGGHNPSLID